LLNSTKFSSGGNLRVAEGVYIEEHEMDRFTSTCNVFARAKPEDKLQIVNSLQRQGKIEILRERVRF
jgi:magnesium-transporting ATPase (P-type)